MKLTNNTQPRRLACIEVSYELLAEMLGFAAHDVTIIRHMPEVPFKGAVTFVIEGEPLPVAGPGEMIPQATPAFARKEEGDVVRVELVDWGLPERQGEGE